MTAQAPSATSAGMRNAMRPGMGGFGSIARAKDPRGAVRRIASYFGPFRARIYVVAVAIVLYTALGLVGPWLMGVALDRYVAHGDASGLPTIGVLMLVAFLGSNVLQAISSWWMAGISQRALKGLRGELFGHLQRLPMSYFDRHASGDLMSRLTNDVDAINQAAAQNVTTLAASLLSMAGILIAMFVLDKWLALASLLVVPIMLALTRWVAVFTKKGFADLQRHLGRLNATMEESISGQKIVNVFRRTDSVVGAFRQENEAVYKAGVHANTYALLLMPLTTVLGNLFIIVLAGFGGFLALEGLVTVGVIATFINYSQNFVGPLRQISNLYNMLQAALAGAERVFEILDTPVEVETAPAGNDRDELPIVGHVRFDDVTFGYSPGVKVIDAVSLDAAPGQLVALVGPTGAGKTTIINLLTRFYEVDRGAIFIDGTDIRQLSKNALRRKVGLVLQDTFLFGTTVMENIRYGRLDASDDDVKRAAELADADHFIRQLPRGYETVLSERGSNLSQGQRQLLAIARTLLADPSILVLDEATSSVDTRTEAHIQKSLLRLMHGRTSFVIAHRLSTIRDADQVLVIDGGRIVERGTHDELLAKKGLYQKLYVSQFKGHAI